MLWAVASLAMTVTTGPGTSVTPIDSATTTVLGYLFSYGPVGIGFAALAWLMLKGWHLVAPGHEAKIRAEARAEARADLIEERDRILAEKHQAEAERDEALRVARDDLIPLLVNFTAATQSLLPLLQQLITQQTGRP